MQLKMTWPWAMFWASIAAMFLAGTSVALSSRGVVLGTLGEWVSGIGTFAAAAAALFIADRERRDRIEREGRAAREALASRTAQDLRLVHNAIQVLYNGLTAASYMVRRYREEEGLPAEMIASFLASTRITEPSRMASEIVPASAHDHEIHVTVATAKTHWFVAVQNLKTLMPSEGTSWEQNLKAVNFIPAIDLLNECLAIAAVLRDQLGLPPFADDAFRVDPF